MTKVATLASSINKPNKERVLEYSSRKTVPYMKVNGLPVWLTAMVA